MTVIAFSMKGGPRGKGRPRVFIQKGRAVATTDPATRRYEASVSKVARKAMADREPLTGPLSVSLRFRMPIPVSTSKRDRAAMLAGEIAPVVKPDLDNLAKSILDGIAEDAAEKKRAGRNVELKAAARICFHNDSQVVRLWVTKIYAEHPGVDIRIEAFAPQGGAQ